MADPYLDALAAEARCFECIPEALHREIQTYIIVVVAELDPDPNVLTGLAKCLRCLDSKTLSAIRLYLLHAIGDRDLDAEAIAASGACWGCTSSQLASATQTYLLSLDDFGPGTSDTDELIRLSKAFRGMPPRTLLEIQVYALAINAGNVDPTITTDAATLAALANCLCLSQSQIEAGTTEAIEWLEPLPDVTDPPLPPNPPGRPSRPVVPRPERPPTEHHPDPPAPPTRPGVKGCVDSSPSSLVPVLTPTYVGGNLTTVDLFVALGCCKTNGYIIMGSNDPSMSGAVQVTTGALLNRAANQTVSGIDLSIYAFDYYAAFQQCGSPLLNSEYSNIIASTPLSLDLWDNQDTSSGVGWAEDGVLVDIRATAAVAVFDNLTPSDGTGWDGNAVLTDY